VRIPPCFRALCVTGLLCNQPHVKDCEECGYAAVGGEVLSILLCEPRASRGSAQRFILDLLRSKRSVFSAAQRPGTLASSFDLPTAAVREGLVSRDGFLAQTICQPLARRGLRAGNTAVSPCPTAHPFSYGSPVENLPMAPTVAADLG
jgi:hypothetical protein